MKKNAKKQKGEKEGGFSRLHEVYEATPMQSSWTRTTLPSLARAFATYLFPAFGQTAPFCWSAVVCCSLAWVGKAHLSRFCPGPSFAHTTESKHPRMSSLICSTSGKRVGWRYFSTWTTADYSVYTSVHTRREPLFIYKLHQGSRSSLLLCFRCHYSPSLLTTMG